MPQIEIVTHDNVEVKDTSNMMLVAVDPCNQARHNDERKPFPLMPQSEWDEILNHPGVSCLDSTKVNL
jgi:hypothetical protein